MSDGPYKNEGETVWASDDGRDTTPVGGNYPDREWIYAQYHVMGKTLSEVGELAGVTDVAVLYHMKKHGIQRRDPNQIQDERLTDEEWLREQYVERGKSGREIAKEIGVGRTALYDALDRVGIEDRHNTNSSGRDRVLDDENVLRREYAYNEKSVVEIAEEYGICTRTVLDRLHEYDIEVRDQSESQLLRWQRENSAQKKDGDGGVIVDGALDMSWKEQNIGGGVWVPYRDEEWVSEHRDAGLSYTDMSEKCAEVYDVDVSYETVRRWAKRLGVA